MLSTLRQLVNWIKLFFWLRKQPMPNMALFDYSNEFQSSVRCAVGYRDYANQALSKLLALAFAGIEEYHVWANDSYAEICYLRLDVCSPDAVRLLDKLTKR